MTEHKKSMAKVSIGMPVYNGSAYIRMALDSLLTQSFKEFELIISDNASTDDTRNICQEYERKDPRIRYIRQKRNLGPIGNFDFVLNQAKGEYFMWAAHDDLWDSKFIASLIQVLELNSGLSMAQCQVTYELVGTGDVLPSFMQGVAFQNREFDKGGLRKNIDQRYGELFYGVYRRSCLKPYLAHFQSDSVDIVHPVLLSSLMVGGACVIDDFLFVKKVTMRVFLWTYLVSKEKGALKNNKIENMLLEYKKNKALPIWVCVRSMLAACKYYLHVCRVLLSIIITTTIKKSEKITLSVVQLNYLVKGLFWTIKAKMTWRI